MGCLRWTRIVVVLVVLVLCVGKGSGGSASEPDRSVDFNYRIRPILSDKCFFCHGPDARHRKGELRLDTREGLFSTRPSGDRVVVPGDAESSVLVERITSDDPTMRMPPATSGRVLEPGEIALIKKWVERGAPWRGHWALEPPNAHPRPVTKTWGWARNLIDDWVLERLGSEGFAPAHEADRATLIRRVTLDLTGLPPRPDEIAAFQADPAPDAYERLVERLLASPRYGERMSVDWLDLARYADTHGYQADVYRPVWPWRDWVIHAYNRNMPFDQFLTWQIAGDLLPGGPREQILATAFNRLHRQTNEGGSIEEEFRAEYVADRVNTFAATFLGMTFECARCHDHKFDPVTQKDYYRLAAFFNSIDESGLYSHFTNATPTPALALSTPDQDRRLEALRRAAARAEEAVDQLRRTRRQAFEIWLKTWSHQGVETSEGLVGDFPLDDLVGSKVQNRVAGDQPGQASDAPEPVPGRIGRGVRFSGENKVTLPLGNFDRYEPFSIALWVKTPDHKDRAVIIHRSMASSDAGSRGYQLLIEDGRPSVGLIHFWPGNALVIRGRDPLPVGQWVHLAFSYDGSSRAGGLTLYVNGRRVPREVVRDGLGRTIRGGGNDHLTLAERFRDRGFKGGEIDEVKVYTRTLSSLEVQALARVANSGAPDSLDPSHHEQLFEYYLLAVDGEARAARASLLEARRAVAGLEDQIDEIMVMRELPRPRPTYLLKRGVYDAWGEKVERGVPAAIGSWRSGWPANRLGLARWLTSPDHPLTARVVVNRLWQACFGRGIVATPEDFGSQGQLPSHPELLDSLARLLIDAGWDQKTILRLIVTSAAYRQDSRAAAAALAQDPENRLLTRGPRVRLSAEMIRDQALAVSGLLVERLGGPPVKPYEPPGLWEEKSGSSYVPDQGPGRHRRSLYTFWKRTSPPPMMLAFDATSREVCVVRRQATATPLQALVLLNDPQFVEAARGLALRILREGGEALTEQLDFACLTAWGRRPSDRERPVLEALIHEQVRIFSANPSNAGRLLNLEGAAPLDPALDRIQLAALTVLAQALMNHDAFVIKR